MSKELKADTQKTGYGALRWLAREARATKEAIAPNGFTGLFSRQNMIKATAFGAVALALNNPLWTNTTDAVKTAQSSGLTDVTAGGYDWQGCGIGNRLALVRTKVEGTNAAGQHVRDTVCKVPFGKSSMKPN